MKSTLKTSPPAYIEHKFPALYKDTGSSLVVLATREHSGIVVKEGGDWLIGDYCQSWASFYNAKDWQRLFPGSSITLVQE